MKASFLLCLLAALSLAACDDDPKPSTPTDTTDLAETELLPDQVEEQVEEQIEEQSELPDIVQSLEITVEYGEQSVLVDVATLATDTIAEQQVVLLSSILLEALPALQLAAVELDFVADDGFSPGQSPNCVDTVPISGSVASQGGLLPDSGNLVWAAELALPGCMKLKNTRKLVVTDP